MKRLLPLLLLALLPTGCDNSAASDIDSFDSPEEAAYAKAGRPFAQAIFKGDYDRAYDMLSSHARDRFTREEFRRFHENAHAEYFKPVNAEPARVVETSPYILSGEPEPGGDAMSRKIDLITYDRYVGEVPDYIPKHIRVASLSATFYDDDPHADDVRACFLTYLLVEDGGELRVANCFYRWPDVWD